MGLSHVKNSPLRTPGERFPECIKVRGVKENPENNRKKRGTAHCRTPFGID